MKTILSSLTVALLMSINVLYAQISFTNNSFEQWNDKTGIPTGWNTLSLDVPMLGTMSFCSIEQSNQSQDGKYSLLMKADRLNPMIVGLASQFLQLDGLDKIYVPAVISNGKFNISMNNLSALLSMAEDGPADDSDLMNNGILSSLLGLMSEGLDVSNLSEQTEYVGGYYDYHPVTENENFTLAVLLTKTENGANTLAGGGVFTSKQATDGFTQFSIPITHLKKADNLYFFAIVTCMNPEQEQSGAFRLDNLNINGTVALSTVTDNGNKVFAYPNPTTNHTFKINTSEPQKVVITNALGQKIKEIPSYNPNEDISIEKSGIYFIQTKEKTLEINVR